ncbi:putative inositol transporter 2 [Camellia lanceoleosa]|uniref:Inositol transporter 2 n=1 Tax=Camellia lanceoleosa TaxID=1840588 RepID=A0ACC0GG14_9ERIC|nr:putative inositol transporter 2 [Camellia lanceoleosa]
MAITGAIIGAAIGGWFNDLLGRSTIILIADFLFFIGAVIMAAAPRKLYPEEDVEAEIQALKESVEAEIQEKGSSEKITLVRLLKTKTVRRGLIAGVGLQVFQQFVGINTVMYYSPTIVQLAGFASNQTALLLSLVTAGLNAGGPIVSIYFIDRTGRKKLLVISLCGVVISLGLLSAVFHETTTHSPAVSAAEPSHFTAYTCPDYTSAGTSAAKWDCMKCLKASSPDCGFCASSTDKLLPGSCLISNDIVKDMCHEDHRLWYTRGCPSKYGWLALIGLALYIIFFSPGMGTVPWIVNSEIYPLSNNAMSLWTKIKGKGSELTGPQPIGKAIMNNLPKSEMVDKCCIAGPRFVNVVLSKDWIAKSIQKMLINGVETWSPKLTVKRAVVDFSSPNIAKEMHVGHLRSTIIRDTLARMLEFSNVEVLWRNHVGDWSTQVVNDQAIGDLEAFYKASKQRLDSDPGFNERAQQAVVSLQCGEEKYRKAWAQICEISRRRYQRVYQRLGIKIEEKAAKRAGWLPAGENMYPKTNHVGFVVRLIDLLDEAKSRCKAALVERGKADKWTAEELDQIAEAVGYGAVK